MQKIIEQKSKATASSYLGLFCKKYSCTECEIKDRCSVYNTEVHIYENKRSNKTYLPDM